MLLRGFLSTFSYREPWVVGNGDGVSVGGKIYVRCSFIYEREIEWLHFHQLPAQQNNVECVFEEQEVSVARETIKVCP